MTIFFFLLVQSVFAETAWNSDYVEQLIHSKAAASNANYLEALCETQLRSQRVPTACYLGASDNKELLRFLDGRCQMWNSGEKDISALEKWLKHPDISAKCQKTVRERLAELQYVQEENAPFDYFQARKKKLAQELNGRLAWKKSSKPNQ